MKSIYIICDLEPDTSKDWRPDYKLGNKVRFNNINLVIPIFEKYRKYGLKINFGMRFDEQFDILTLDAVMFHKNNKNIYDKLISYGDGFILHIHQYRYNTQTQKWEYLLNDLAENNIVNSIKKFNDFFNYSPKSVIFSNPIDTDINSIRVLKNAHIKMNFVEKSTRLFCQNCDNIPKNLKPHDKLHNIPYFPDKDNLYNESSLCNDEDLIIVPMNTISNKQSNISNLTNDNFIKLFHNLYINNLPMIFVMATESITNKCLINNLDFIVNSELFKNNHIKFDILPYNIDDINNYYNSFR